MSNQLHMNDVVTAILFVLGVVAGWHFGLAYFNGL